MRVFLFAYTAYEAGGGMDDYVGAFDTVDEAKAAFEQLRHDSADIAALEANELKTLWSYGLHGLRPTAREWREVGRLAEGYP